jgi:hypothetical protein
MHSCFLCEQQSANKHGKDKKCCQGSEFLKKSQLEPFDPNCDTTLPRRRKKNNRVNHQRALRASKIPEVASSIQFNRQGTLRKNVALVQKSCKTSVEQSFFAGCPS